MRFTSIGALLLLAQSYHLDPQPKTAAELAKRYAFGAEPRWLAIDEPRITVQLPASIH